MTSDASGREVPETVKIRFPGLVQGHDLATDISFIE
jgi:hypothetical protein